MDPWNNGLDTGELVRVKRASPEADSITNCSTHKVSPGMTSPLSCPSVIQATAISPWRASSLSLQFTSSHFFLPSFHPFLSLSAQRSLKIVELGCCFSLLQISKSPLIHPYPHLCNLTPSLFSGSLNWFLVPLSPFPCNLLLSFPTLRPNCLCFQSLESIEFSLCPEIFAALLELEPSHHVNKHQSRTP